MEHSIWWLFFAMAAGVGVFFSLLIFSKPEKLRRGTPALGVLVLVFSITLIQYVLHWSGNFRSFPHMAGLWKACNYLYGPLLLYFFWPEKEISHTSRLFHFIPFFLLLIAWLPFGVLPTAEKLEWMQHSSPFDTFLLPHHFLLWLLHPAVMVGSQLLYVVFFLYQTKQKAFQPLIALLFTGFVAANATYFILVKTPYFTLLWDYLISLAMTFCIFRLGLLAFHQPSYFFLPQKVQQEKYTTSSLSKVKSKKLADRIRTLVEKEEKFLESDLRLSSLAEELDASPQYVSQAVNEHFGCSFSQWINRYRIDYACTLLEKGASAKEAGYQSGFNNLSTFYQVFKKEKGIPPAKYSNKLNIY
jgi:AraC-like DNA-binding protein